MRAVQSGVMVCAMAVFGLSASVVTTPGVAAAGMDQKAVDAAFACQVRVIQKMQKDAGGRVFVSFDRFPEVSGQNVSGPGVDRFDSVGRPLSYSCKGTDVSYSFRDGKPAKAADARLRFPSAAVVNCQNAVRSGLIFDSAAMTKSDNNLDWILGVSGSKTSQCQINDTRIVSVK